MKAGLIILALAFIQNVSFSIVSRSRNRNNMQYHLIASIFSNTIWFMTMKALITTNMDFWLFIPYVTGTVSGSLAGAKTSMWIERRLNAQSDDHLQGAR